MIGFTNGVDPTNQELELTPEEREAQVIAELSQEEAIDNNEVACEEVIDNVEEEIAPYLDGLNGERYEFKEISRNLYKIIAPLLNKGFDIENFEKIVGKVLYAQHGVSANDYKLILDKLYDEEGIQNEIVLLSGIITYVLGERESKNAYVVQEKNKLAKK